MSTPRAPRRRWLTVLIVFLLITIPAGYLVISAIQSRNGNGGQDKQENAAATGLTTGWPSRLQRRIYQVPIPAGSREIAYYENNSWSKSALYARFAISQQGLEVFLNRIGSSRTDLVEGRRTIDPAAASKVNWTFTPDNGAWSGLVIKQPEPKPELRVTVNMRSPTVPVVYVLSTVTP